MKLIITIISDADNEPVSQALIIEGFRVTRISSTGGFLRRGQSTLMIGVADEKVDEAIQIIRESLPAAADPNIKRATLFVLNVEDFSQI
ncbi:MAG: cyclic-di-AMP receptor [Anaerolineales bacterium]|nr:cyclic-di-AMP receptor [Anaerolineales bacterium]